MYAGQQASYDGHQYCLFPMDYMRCTQTSGPDSLSHCCGHPCDWAGPDPNNEPHYPYYAPCDCSRIWEYPAYGETLYVSDAPVWTPQGLTYVSFMFTHDDNYPSQTHFNQGDLIGHTGTKGYALGPHLHLDQSLVKDDQLVKYSRVCRGGNECWALRNSTYAYDVFYLGGTEQIVNLQGMPFVTIPEQPGPEPGPTPPGPVTPTGSLSAAVLLLLCKYKRRSENARKRIRV